MTEQQIIECTVKALKRNFFDVYRAATAAEAGQLFKELIVPKIDFESWSWGDSATMRATGALDILASMQSKTMIKTFDADYDFDTKIAMRRKALTSDLFLTGTNALTQKGQLVNTDMIGNRVAPIAFGPKTVVVFVSKDKIVPTIDDAFERIRTIAAPLNAKRHTALHTPCQITGSCMECHSPDRICNVRTIQERSFPANRIKVVLIDQKLGL